ncbi:MAG: hypothetical protein PHD48_10125 [Alphaproteobacteria bacterium]|nr:hypothetical protein [Alphaproteobacteria bacterium]
MPTELYDLKAVGCRKLVGYCTTCVLMEEFGIADAAHVIETEVPRLQEEAKARGMASLFVDQKDFRIEFNVNENNERYQKGALYVYDAENLQKYLNLRQSREILAMNEWPTDAHAFVKKIAKERVYESGPLHDLVDLVFGDSLNYAEYPGGPVDPYPPVMGVLNVSQTRSSDRFTIKANLGAGLSGEEEPIAAQKYFFDFEFSNNRPGSLQRDYADPEQLGEFVARRLYRELGDDLFEERYEIGSSEKAASRSLTGLEKSAFEKAFLETKAELHLRWFDSLPLDPRTREAAKKKPSADLFCA